MMHATSESDITSIAPSSSSPTAYYVESPSRDSHDEMDKCSSSNSRSPMESPCYPRHSMTSSSSTAASRIYGNRRRWNKHYCNVVAEEDSVFDGDDDYCKDGPYSIHCKCLSLVLAFGIFFLGFVWHFGLLAGLTNLNLASRIQRSKIEGLFDIGDGTDRLKVQNLYFGEGSDHTGVPTKLISVNCSANLVIYNPAKVFGIHVTSHTANLLYAQITVATVEEILPTKKEHEEYVGESGGACSLYGAGMALTASDESGGIPFKLEFAIQSRGYLVGKLVKTKHTTHASCSLLINSKHTKQIKFGHNSCKYI
ncbi:hypothetical protein DH2020_039366 [Rehmannia glutinosa]|uniref:Late embryogenesis abundant protein LEA-2 subgroup domain-containing protein n=1 Tax=Rehmannia glutinosa TaxID=99300 RepID=A0ABR0UW02_REHGL